MKRCRGIVEERVPGDPACLQGPFGEIVVNLKQPCVSSLKLRQQDGVLGVKSLLNTVIAGSRLAENWWLLGPFATEQEADLLKAHIRDEASADPSQPAVRADGAVTPWVPYRLKGIGAEVDFAKGLNAKVEYPKWVAYGATSFESPRAGFATLFLTVDWHAMVWLNGQEILCLDAPERVRRGRENLGQDVELNVPIRQGTNHIVIKCMTGANGFYAAPRILYDAAITAAAHNNLANMHQVGAYSYVEDKSLRRYQSHFSRKHVVERADDREIVIRGIELLSQAGGEAPPVVEDWRFALDQTGDIRWTITRRWQREFQCRLNAAPGLFFNIRANAEPTGSGQRRLNPEQNAVATLLWVDPSMLAASDRYPELLDPVVRSTPLCFKTRNHVVYRRQDGWALVKLYTSFPNDQDLYLKPENGFLFRRGKYNAHNELGLTADEQDAPAYRKGQATTTTLAIGRRPARNAGLQLHCEIPDKRTEESLAEYFNGLANAGAWCSQAEYLLGNQVEGYLWAGNVWMHAFSYLAGLDAGSPASRDPHDYGRALRGYLEWILTHVDANGFIRVSFGELRRQEGFILLEDRFQTIIAVEAYYLASGDAEFLRHYRDALRRLSEAPKRYVRDNLLVFGPDDKAMIYFDCLKPTGAVAFINNWRIRSLEAYATILDIIGDRSAAQQTRERREAAIRAYNRAFWGEDTFGPGKAGYVDWIKPDGTPCGYFLSGTQYPAIVFGIASPEQARQILKTADERLAELTRLYGYQGDATLDTLWPVPDDQVTTGIWPPTGTTFGGYMNGGILPCWTYFDVVARSLTGDVAGAYERLRRFAGHAARTNWYEGDNAFDMQSKPFGYAMEPYLADQVVVAAALIHGILGIRQTPEGVKVSGGLPPGWRTAKAVVPWLGKRVVVIREDSRVTLRLEEERSNPQGTSA